MKTETVGDATLKDVNLAIISDRNSQLWHD